MWAACPRSLCMHSCGSSSTHGRVVVTRAWRTGSAAITHSPPIWQPQLLSHDTNSGGAPSARRRRDCRLQQFCWQPAGRTLQSPAAMELSGVHESVVQRLLALLDVRSKCSLMCSCRALHAALASRCEHWRELVLDSEGEQRACGARELLYMLQRASGRCEVLALARSEQARAAEGQQRFSNGIKCDQVLPHTRGLRALALTAAVPHLRTLVIDEAASCVGGMTDDLARGLAVHCRRLAVLEVGFVRYSLPSELFTDEGLIALTQGCSQLARLALRNCDRISDRSLYAVAANCGSLTSLTLGGYNEHVTDGGLTVIAEACSNLACLRLSAKLTKVTDVTGAALGRHCGQLASLKMTRAMTDATLAALAAGCRQLSELDLQRCADVSHAGLAVLLAGCPRLVRLALPQQLDGAGLPRCSLEAGRQLQVLALQH